LDPLAATSPPPRLIHRGVPALYGLTIFLGAFLLFLIEPIIAKRLLPWFGGSAAVWITCLVFFQTALLFGYLYADVATGRLTIKRRIVLHIVLLAASLLFLPIALSPHWKTGAGEPTWRILALLTASIGLPFLLLSATGPLVQDWYARALPATPPYRLFALSNLASLLALLSYPFLLEPLTSGHTQLLTWSVLFALFVVLCSSAAWLSRNSPTPLRGQSAMSPRSTWPRRLLWIGLAACSSTLLLAVTNHLCQNIAPVPLLWVVPLALYLLTFVVAFNRHNWYPRWWILRLLVVMLAAMGYALYDVDAIESAPVFVPVFCIGLFIACWFCHGELNSLRPDPRYLTSFYLAIAFGGALGAIFVGLIAPQIFDNLYEMPIALLMTAILASILNWNTHGDQRWPARALWASVSIAMAIVLVMQIQGYQRDSIAMMRSFYGALRVTQSRNIGPQQERTLFHGTITHGSQYLMPPLRTQPTTYYTRRSGAGYALRFCCAWPKRVGIIGLGAGTLATYGLPGDSFRFYEINPQVIQIAQSLFTYLRDSKAKIDIIPGDARLSLEAEPPQEFDVLVIDAFSGDAIPVHLLTREAMALYLRHLQPNGILAFHVSNNYLRLAPVVERLAEAYGYKSFMVETEANTEDLSAASQWVLVTRKRNFIQLLGLSLAGETVPVPPGLPVWNDDYNNLFQVLAPLLPELTQEKPKP
jgi:SAM-dependent methyltransferase